MHVRVLLARYRSYHTCEACGGARLLPEALVWRLGTIDDRQNAAAALGSDMPSVEPIVTGQQLSQLLTNAFRVSISTSLCFCLSAN